MTKKTTLSFTDKHHDFLMKKVNEGAFASASSVVAAGIEQMMQDEVERNVALEVMKDIVRERMTLPKGQWIKHDNDERFFKSIADHLQDSVSS